MEKGKITEEQFKKLTGSIKTNNVIYYNPNDPNQISELIITAKTDKFITLCKKYGINKDDFFEAYTLYYGILYKRKQTDISSPLWSTLCDASLHDINVFNVICEAERLHKSPIFYMCRSYIRLTAYFDSLVKGETNVPIHNEDWKTELKELVSETDNIYNDAELYEFLEENFPMIK